MMRWFDQPRSLAMIVLAAAMLMAGSAPSAPSQERNALGTCLAKFVHDKLTDKMDPAVFKAAAKAGCAAQAAAFRAAWIRYDVAMRTKSSEAAENADSQIDDYLQNSTDSYVDVVAPPKPRVAAAASPMAPASSATPVTPASSTTPPKP
jgi:hypothetical protein